MQGEGFSWWLKAILKLLVPLCVQKDKDKSSQMYPEKGIANNEISEEHL